MLCQKIYKHANFDKIKLEIENIIQTVDFSKGQIMCQTLEEGSDNWNTGTGRFNPIAGITEQSYKHINPVLAGTEIEKLILHHNAFRTRIMLMKPSQCYSVHSDVSARMHLPIITNDQCWMIWPKHSECYQLKAGNVYFTDTREPHTFLNGSKDQTRVHLVMCISN